MAASGDLSNADVESAYARWAPIYDRVFATIMRPGRRAAAAAINAHGGHALDIGVGTGLELPMFSRAVRVTGVDLCAPMLEIARARVDRLGLDNVEALRVMDAMNLAFADAAFDAVVAPFVLTVVPDAARTLDEMARVTRPGGEIVLVNHIAATRGPIATIEGWLAPRAATLGWRPQFPWSIVGDWLARRDDVELLERRTLPPLGLFALVRMRRR